MRWGSWRNMQGSQGVHRDGVDNILQGSTEIKAWRARKCRRENGRGTAGIERPQAFATMDAEVKETLDGTLRKK